jgi:hypothetical protein
VLLSGKECPPYRSPEADANEREPVIVLSNEARASLARGEQHRYFDQVMVPRGSSP